MSSFECPVNCALLGLGRLFGSHIVDDVAGHWLSPALKEIERPPMCSDKVDECKRRKREKSRMMATIV